MFKPIEPLAQAPCENTEKGVITEVLLRIRVETPVHTFGFDLVAFACLVSCAAGLGGTPWWHLAHTGGPVFHGAVVKVIGSPTWFHRLIFV